MKNNLHVFLGATVADAAARPLHWVYNQTKLLKYIKGKKDEEGIIERKNLLEKNGFSKTFIKKNLFKKDNFYKQDDFLDACSLFWTANRVASKKEIRIPNDMIVDIDGIIMQIRV